MMVIERPEELRRIAGPRGWVLVYGRRKTGKTFLIEQFIRADEHFFVKRDGGIASLRSGTTLGYDAFRELLIRALADGKTVVVDEFHRLGDEFFDFLHATKKGGKLILVSSTLALSRKLLASRSPLLGFFAEAPVGLIRLSDCLAALRKRGLAKRPLLERALFCREPIAIAWLGEQPGPALLAAALAGALRTIPALVGEVFFEEERRDSAVYEGILRAVAIGKVSSGEIADVLFSRKRIAKNDPSLVQQYLNNLVSIGVLKKLPVYGRSRFVYKHASPLARLFYYADEKYNITNRSVTAAELERISAALLPRLVEDAVREHLAEKLGLAEAVAEGRDYEVDACLLRFQKPEVVAEVKWKERVTAADVRAAEAALARIPAKRRLLVVPDKRRVPASSLEVLDPDDL